MMTPRLALALLLAAGPALAELPPGTAPADADRLEAVSGHFGWAMRQALAGGEAGDVSALVTALSGMPGGADFTGDWSCRTMKLGGLLPLTVYSPFRCRITATGEGAWLFEKLSGSQLTRGTIHDAGGDLVYLGVGYINGADPISYETYHSGAIPPEAGQVTADVGYLEVVSPTRARLMLPAPMLESDFDILELTR